MSFIDVVFLILAVIGGNAISSLIIGTSKLIAKQIFGITEKEAE